MGKRIRESNFELLRIVSMILVMVVHSDFKALGIPSIADITESPVSSYMRFFTESISIVCVNLFVLISGWFSIKFKLFRLAELLFQILFFCIVMFSVLACIGDFHFSSPKDIINYFADDYWFIWAYLILYLFAPVLNSFAEKATKKELEVFLVLFYLIQTLFGVVISLPWYYSGYSPLSFMGLYVLGRYLRLYPQKYTTMKKSFDFTIYLSIAFLSASIALFLSANNINSLRFYTYSSPFVIIDSISFFLFFTKLSFKSNIINWIAISCFSIYLVHCFPGFFESNFLSHIKDWFENTNSQLFILYTTLWFLMLCVVSVLFDKIRIYIWQKTYSLFGK